MANVKSIWNFGTIPTNEPYRRESLDGREYIVVPMVMILEGVHTGSQGPVYYSVDELAKTPRMWNMKPIVLEHPFRGDSATDLEVYKKQSVGLIMNTQFVDGKLKAEAWIDVQKAEEKCPDILTHIQHRLPMEVSTGLFSELILEEGNWLGEPYKGRIVNIRADHLAILPHKQGACSLSDGAGLLINESFAPVKDEDGLIFNAVTLNASASVNNGATTYVAGSPIVGDDDDDEEEDTANDKDAKLKETPQKEAEEGSVKKDIEDAFQKQVFTTADGYQIVVIPPKNATLPIPEGKSEPIPEDADAAKKQTPDETIVPVQDNATIISRSEDENGDTTFIESLKRYDEHIANLKTKLFNQLQTYKKTVNNLRTVKNKKQGKVNVKNGRKVVKNDTDPAPSVAQNKTSNPFDDPNVRLTTHEQRIKTMKKVAKWLDEQRNIHESGATSEENLYKDMMRPTSMWSRILPRLAKMDIIDQQSATNLAQCKTIQDVIQQGLTSALYKALSGVHKLNLSNQLVNPEKAGIGGVFLAAADEKYEPLTLYTQRAEINENINKLIKMEVTRQFIPRFYDFCIQLKDILEKQQKQNTTPTVLHKCEKDLATIANAITLCVNVLADMTHPDDRMLGDVGEGRVNYLSSKYQPQIKSKAGNNSVVVEEWEDTNNPKELQGDINRLADAYWDVYRIAENRGLLNRLDSYFDFFNKWNDTVGTPSIRYGEKLRQQMSSPAFMRGGNEYVMDLEDIASLLYDIPTPYEDQIRNQPTLSKSEIIDLIRQGKVHARWSPAVMKQLKDLLKERLQTDKRLKNRPTNIAATYITKGKTNILDDFVDMIKELIGKVGDDSAVSSIEKIKNDIFAKYTRKNNLDDVEDLGMSLPVDSSYYQDLLHGIFHIPQKVVKECVEKYNRPVAEIKTALLRQKLAGILEILAPLERRQQALRSKIRGKERARTVTDADLKRDNITKKEYEEMVKDQMTVLDSILRGVDAEGYSVLQPRPSKPKAKRKA